MQISTTAPPPLGLAHFTVLDLAPLDLVAMAASLGFATVGLRLWPAFPGSPCYEIPAGSAAMRAMRTRLADTGIRVHDIEFVVVDQAFDPANLIPVLESAAELGARRLSLCGDDPDTGRMTASFAAICQLASGYGLGVDIEVMVWRAVGSLAGAVEVVGAADQANGGVLVDALHLDRSGAVPEDLAAVPPGFIRSAQLCDAPAQRPAGTEAIVAEARGGRLAPGDGDLPLQRLLAQLPDHAVLSVEVPDTGDDARAHAARVFEAARRTLVAAAS